jgi:hypothetical protein
MLRIGALVRFCVEGHEHSLSIKDEEPLGQHNKYQLLKMNTIQSIQLNLTCDLRGTEIRRVTLHSGCVTFQFRSGSCFLVNGFHGVL